MIVVEDHIEYSEERRIFNQLLFYLIRLYFIFIFYMISIIINDIRESTQTQLRYYELV